MVGKLIRHERSIYECIFICALDTNVSLGTVLVHYKQTEHIALTNQVYEHLQRGKRSTQ